jgi:hypothetical protein
MLKSSKMEPSPVYQEIDAALADGRGLLVGRFGTVELEVLLGDLSSQKRQVLERNAGIFPSDLESVERWMAASRKAYGAADVLATGWYPPLATQEKELLRDWEWNGIQVPLRALEPYYWNAEQRWTRLLAGRRVCVVTSFATTAAAQIAKGEERVWKSAAGSIWAPGVEWSWVQTGYPPSVALGRAGWDGLESWEEAVGQVVREVVATEAEVVIVGCGGLGMLIGAALRSSGKVVIVMGGATQVLFGICGARWGTHPVIRTFWNSEWVWPSASETPAGAGKIEGGCYWKGVDGAQRGAT